MAAGGNDMIPLRVSNPRTRDGRTMYARRTSLLGIGIAFIAMGPVHAFKITGTAPTVEFHSIGNSKFPGLQAYFQGKMNTEVQAAFNGSIASADSSLSGFGSQKQLAQGMANANV